MKLTIRFIIIFSFKSIELIEINAILNKNEKLDIIVIVFFDSAITNLIDNSNKEENNLINANSNVTKATILKITKAAILETTKE